MRNKGVSTWKALDLGLTYGTGFLQASASPRGVAVAGLP